MRRHLLPFLCVAAVVPAQDWRPAPGRLKTPWTEAVNPQNALPEHPRPLRRRPNWQSLNGLWEYAITADDAPLPATWDGKILVPFPLESSLSGVGRTLPPGKRLWYRRPFTLTEGSYSQRRLLHFEAVDWEASVFVDGRLLGTHRGGYDPFTLELEGALGAPGQHTVMVAVRDPSDAGPQPRGKQVQKPNGIWYTPSSGIWQTVWIEGVPAAFVRDFDVQADRLLGTVTVRVQVDGDARGRNLRARAFAGAQVVAEGTGAIQKPLVLTIPSARSWSPGDPFLYGLEVSLQPVEAESGPADFVGTSFAFRDIALGPDAQGRTRILLNGEPLFQYGPLDQGFWPDGLYTAPTDAALRSDVLAVQRMGGNMLRKHVKVEPERFYYHCDQLGILVWQDMPSGDCEKDPQGFERELRAMITARRKHPSIVMWVVFNEGWGQHDTERYTKLVRELDPDRLVCNASGWTDRKCGSVIDVHSYPGPAMAPPEALRASVLGEFGGLGLPLKGHTWVDKDNWGYATFPDQAALTSEYVRRLKALRPLIAQGLSAAVYTQTTDVEIEVNGWLTYDRALWKVDPEQARAAAQLLHEPFGTVRTVVPTAQDGPQRWRYTTNKPPDGWTAADFDDSGWQEGTAGFGTAGTPRALVGSTWNTADVWIRRKFELPAVPLSDPQFVVHHDEDCEVFLNGTAALALAGYTTSYQLEPMPETAHKLLRTGANTLAVHCRQTRGGQYIDVGIAEVLPVRAAGK